MYVYSKDGTLYHHGIKGQKWGVRRFQYKDGSLTPAGEKRYDDPNNSSSGKQKGQSPSTSNSDAAKAEARKKRIKTAAAIGAAAVGTALAAYGGYKLAQVMKKNKVMEKGKERLNDMMDRIDTSTKVTQMRFKAGSGTQAMKWYGKDRHGNQKLYEFDRRKDRERARERVNKAMDRVDEFKKVTQMRFKAGSATKAMTWYDTDRYGNRKLYGFDRRK